MMANQDASEIFKVLGVRSRLRILELLKSQGPLGPNRIAVIIGITPAAVSQHLRVMQQAGLVTPQRQGYWIPYAIDEKTLEKCRHLVNSVCACHGFTVSEKKKTVRKSESSRSDSAGTAESSTGDNELDALKNYKQRLEGELSLIEQRIKDLEK